MFQIIFEDRQGDNRSNAAAAADDDDDYDDDDDDDEGMIILVLHIWCHLRKENPVGSLYIWTVQFSSFKAKM